MGRIANKCPRRLRRHTYIDGSIDLTDLVNPTTDARMRRRWRAGASLFLLLLLFLFANRAASFIATMLRPAAAAATAGNKRPRLTTAAAASSSSSSSSSSSQPAGGLPELYCTEGKRERPLRVLFVGHNPSMAAWKMGHYYANPSNRFWHLLRESGMIPADFTCEQDRLLPDIKGMGFTDLGTGIPGTKSNEFKATVLHSWRASFYQRLKAHAARSGAPPKVVAFTGKRQFQELLFDYASKPAVEYGMQTVRPKGFPFTPEQTTLFVLTSPSGASALKNDERLAPYTELAKLVEAIPWEPEE